MKTLRKKQTSESPDLGQQALTLAVALVLERVRTLPQDDRNDLYELAKESLQADSDEDMESIKQAILEILDQRPVQVLPLDLSARPGPELSKWMAFVSARIRDRRRRAGLTQEQLAAKCGLPQSHLSRLEAGKHSPSRLTLEKIAASLKLPLSDLDPSA